MRLRPLCFLWLLSLVQFLDASLLNTSVAMVFFLQSSTHNIKSKLWKKNIQVPSHPYSLANYGFKLKLYLWARKSHLHIFSWLAGLAHRFSGGIQEASSCLAVCWKFPSGTIHSKYKRNTVQLLLNLELNTVLQEMNTNTIIVWAPFCALHCNLFKYKIYFYSLITEGEYIVEKLTISEKA